MVKYNSKLLFLCIFFINLSCSGLLRLEQRKIASIISKKVNDLNFTVIDNCQILSGDSSYRGKCFELNGSVNVYGKDEGYNQFDFPLINLQSPYYYSVPYKINITSKKTKCISSSGIESKGNEFTVLSNYSKEYILCSNDSSKSGTIDFTYKVPYFSGFEVKEAEWMRGFFPDIINNTELKLSQILSKWDEAFRKNSNAKVSDAITYRGRELLLKYEGNTEVMIFDPKRNKYQFEKKLNDGDIVIVSDIFGNINHPQLGVSDSRGIPTSDYIKNGVAGKAYLEPVDVKPYAFFCRFKDELITFDYQKQYTFNKPGLLKCSINTRKGKFFWFKKPKGQLEATIRSLDLKEVISRLPSRLLNAKIRLDNKLYIMNATNIENLKKWLIRAINSHENDIQYFLEVEKVFPHILNEKVFFKHTELKHKVLMSLIEEGVDQVNIEVTSKNSYMTLGNKSFNTSDEHLGVLKVSKVKNKNIGKSLDKNVAGSYFEIDYILNFKDLLKYKGAKTIELDKYQTSLDAISSSYSNSKSAEVDLELHRVQIQVCGQVEAYLDYRGLTSQKVIIDHFKAVYDSPSGGAVIEKSGVIGKDLFSKSYYLDKKEVYFTKIPFNGKETESCFKITPENFATGDYLNAILLNSY